MEIGTGSSQPNLSPIQPPRHLTCVARSPRYGAAGGAHCPYIYIEANPHTYTGYSTRVSTHVLRDYASYHYADRSLESKVRTVSVARTYISVCTRVCIYVYIHILYIYRYSVSASHALYRMEFQIQMSEGLNNRRSNFARDNTDFLPCTV